ncbi:MAG: glycosyltransferase [Chloroflexi bacterium]|nr:glycosyltransferase [Chloroflexota bacterium]MCY3581250.1 glycosyltransferase [Chloroflexota bacterium]MCY3716443.1 glycosyltransferase [Chloroflexota bacterium]MDE2651304.1 glycosyltransferase [Chloroflexota bacterium]MXX50031.1 glycosyltransferase [Chloroflexota bacterium]
MSNQPLVSIIIPTFNRRHIISDAIDSGLAQTHPHCEIIVVDDGSGDDTFCFLQGKYGEQIRLFRQENQGPGIARNRGIAEAGGEFIHFLDADDQLLPENVATCLEVFRQRPQVSVVYSHYQFVAADGTTPQETPPFERFSQDPFCELLAKTGCHILISSSMYRAAALRAVGGFEADTRFRSAEDWDLFLRLARQHKFYGIDQRLVLRRMHGDMLSDDKLRGAWGRLRTVQNARAYGWEACMSADEFDSKEAARHHMLALYLWQQGERRRARQHFEQAMAICPGEARPRRLFWLYTWLLPASAMVWTSRIARVILRR